MTTSMDPYMIRDFAQEMNRALATAESMLSYQTSAIQRVRELHNKSYDNSCSICIKDLDYDEYLPIYEEYPCPTIQALDKDLNV